MGVVSTNIATSNGGNSDVTKAYVDSQDGEILESAKSYTDGHAAQVNHTHTVSEISDFPEIPTAGVTEEQLNSAVSAHDADENAHPSILSQINEIKDRVLALEIVSGAEVTANPFTVIFGNLDGITTNAVWNDSEARLEF